MRVIKKLGYKAVTDFYVALGEEILDINRVIAEYDALIKATEEEAETKSAETFTLQPTLPRSGLTV